MTDFCIIIIQAWWGSSSSDELTTQANPNRDEDPLSSAEEVAILEGLERREAHRMKTIWQSNDLFANVAQSWGDPEKSAKLCERSVMILITAPWVSTLAPLQRSGWMGLRKKRKYFAVLMRCSASQAKKNYDIVGKLRNITNWNRNNESQTELVDGRFAYEVLFFELIWYCK